jgi:hypothetical protein
VADSRIERYATLPVDTCVRVQPGWQVDRVGHARCPTAARGDHASARVARLDLMCWYPTPALAGAPRLGGRARSAAALRLARRRGRRVRGIRLPFSGGRVVDASAESDEDFLLQTLDTDDGARRIGELGIGCNPGITRYARNVYFDEKIDGTVHIALGSGLRRRRARPDAA